jgi:hypothetical protein
VFRSDLVWKNKAPIKIQIQAITAEIINQIEAIKLSFFTPQG